MNSKPTDPSGGSAADVLIENNVTVVGGEADSEVRRAAQAILNHLCARYKTTGKNDPIQWRGLWRELGLDEKAYGVALEGIVNSIDVELTADHDFIQLGPGGRVHCKG